MASFFYWLTTAFTVIIVCYCWSQYKLSYWKRMGVHSLPTHWLFGNFKESFCFKQSAGIIISNLHLQGSNEGQKNNDLLGMYVFWKPFLIIRSPELIKQILVKDFKTFSNRHIATEVKYDVVGTKNLFAIDDPEWKFLRQKLTMVFSTGKIKKFFNLILENSMEMKDFIDKQLPDESTVKTLSATDISRKYTANNVLSFAFGVKADGFGPNSIIYNQRSKVIGLEYVEAIRNLLLFFFPGLAGYVGARMLGNAAPFYRKVFWESMNERERSGIKRGDLIDCLLEIKNTVQDDQFKMEGDVLFAQSVVFFLAGSESNTSLITFTLYELAKQPYIQDRVRQEIKEKLQGQDLTYNCIQEIKYLQQVISETLRMYPPVPFLDRKSAEDYQVPGTKIVIKKGMAVYIPAHGLHYDPKYFKNPTSYNPDRFSDENKGNIVPYTYLPFGEGPRSCIAMRLGVLQATVALINIISNYEVSLSPLTNVEINKRAVFLQSASDIMLNFQKITVNH